MKNKSKRSYRIYFIIINFLFGIVGCSYLMILFVKPENQSIAVFLLLFVIWNIISFLSAKKLFKDEDDLRGVVIYDENYKKQVRRYRNVNYTSFIILLGSFALMILYGNGYVSEGVAQTLFPVLLFTGLISLFITVFYFSGLKNISANEIVVYPFQFINDPLLKKQLLEKKIKFYTRSIYIIPIIFIVLYVFDIFDAKALVVGFLVGTSTVPYKIRQLKSMIN